MVEGEGFEPSKAEPSDLQSDPFGHSGIPPRDFCVLSGYISRESSKAPLSEKMVEGEGFEPSKAEPSDLQSDPFGHSGIPPRDFYVLSGFISHESRTAYHFHQKWWRGKDSNLRRRSRQIYSLIPLATREPLHKCGADNSKQVKTVNPFSEYSSLLAGFFVVLQVTSTVCAFL